MEKLTWTGTAVQTLVERAERLIQSDRRCVLGIAGAPASGKSTLATMLFAELRARHPGAVVLVGMDAFHIGHRVLEERGLVQVKGAPETFDVAGYLAMLARIRTAEGTIYAPEFRRDIEDSIAHTVEITTSARLVITEGNYLLLQGDPWGAVRDLLDEAWFVHLVDSERQRRMIRRHQSYGHSVEVATTRALGNDETNARLVNAFSGPPDVWIEQETV